MDLQDHQLSEQTSNDIGSMAYMHAYLQAAGLVPISMHSVVCTEST